MNASSPPNFLASISAERELWLTPSAQKLMAEDAEARFPNECCGFFFGRQEGNRREVSEAWAIPNVEPGDQRHRFLMDSREYLRAEAYAREQALHLLGVYHSHPNHPAIPSSHDHQTAWPGFSYLIVPVQGGKADSFRSWSLDAEDHFAEESVFLLAGH